MDPSREDTTQLGLHENLRKKKKGAEIITDCKDKDNKKTYFLTPTFRRRKEHLGPVKTDFRTIAKKTFL